MEACPHDKDIPDKLVPALIKCVKDAIPNIKIVICKIFKKLVTTVSLSNNTTNLIKAYKNAYYFLFILIIFYY